MKSIQMKIKLKIGQVYSVRTNADADPFDVWAIVSFQNPFRPREVGHFYDESNIPEKDRFVKCINAEGDFVFKRRHTFEQTDLVRLIVDVEDS